MSLIFILTLAIQAGLIVHVIRTGRNTLWIWAIALLPAAGSLAYVIVEILPGIFGGRAARRTKAGMQRIIDPNRDLRQAAAAVEISGNLDARRRLAQELYERGQFDEAIAVCQAGLKGVFEHDPTLLLGLAQAQFAAHLLHLLHGGVQIGGVEKTNADFAQALCGSLGSQLDVHAQSLHHVG